MADAAPPYTPRQSYVSDEPGAPIPASFVSTAHCIHDGRSFVIEVTAVRRAQEVMLTELFTWEKIVRYERHKLTWPVPADIRQETLALCSCDNVIVISAASAHSFGLQFFTLNPRTFKVLHVPTTGEEISRRCFYAIGRAGPSKLLVAGGHLGRTYTSECFIVDLLSRRMVSGPALPAALDGFTLTPISDSRLLLIGGYNGAIGTRVFYFDASYNKWVACRPAPFTARWRHSVINPSSCSAAIPHCLQECLLLFGGYAGRPLGDMWAYYYNSDRWYCITDYIQHLSTKEASLSELKISLSRSTARDSMLVSGLPFECVSSAGQGSPPKTLGISGLLSTMGALSLQDAYRHSGMLAFGSIAGDSRAVPLFGSVYRQQLDTPVIASPRREQIVQQVSSVEPCSPSPLVGQSRCTFNAFVYENIINSDPLTKGSRRPVLATHEDADALLFDIISHQGRGIDAAKRTAGEHREGQTCHAPGRSQDMYPHASDSPAPTPQAASRRRAVQKLSSSLALSAANPQDDPREDKPLPSRIHADSIGVSPRFDSILLVDEKSIFAVGGSLGTVEATPLADVAQYLSEMLANARQ